MKNTKKTTEQLGEHNQRLMEQCTADLLAQTVFVQYQLPETFNDLGLEFSQCGESYMSMIDKMGLTGLSEQLENQNELQSFRDTAMSGISADILSRYQSLDDEYKTKVDELQKQVFSSLDSLYKALTG